MSLLSLAKTILGNAFKMATKAPRDPLVIVLGSTGTGKSDLAVELALRFNGEIINSDAMQMYKGLPISTNKMSIEEQRRVPHHLLGHIDATQDVWHVPRFKAEAGKIIDDIRQKGRLPILVGGTHYYIDSLLFRDSIVEVGEPYEENPEDVHPILQGSPELILEKLKEVDPIMAERWHPNETRKIKRSLEIYLKTGRRASDIYAEQAQKVLDSAKDSSALPSALLFWVYTEPVILEERLRKRVDKMVVQGALDEIGTQIEVLRSHDLYGDGIDRTQGIWQSIGMKELMPYFHQKQKEGKDEQEESPHDVLLQRCLEDMKVATRKCARDQLKWIRKKTIPGLQKHNMSDSLFLVDSSDISLWSDNVLRPAFQLTEKFLAGLSLPQSTSISLVAKEVLSSTIHRKPAPSRRVCDVCNRVFVMEHEWERHLRSKPHRRAVKGARKRSLVPLGQRPLSLVVARSTSVKGGGNRDGDGGGGYGGGDGGAEAGQSNRTRSSPDSPLGEITALPVFEHDGAP